MVRGPSGLTAMEVRMSRGLGGAPPTPKALGLLLVVLLLSSCGLSTPGHAQVPDRVQASLSRLEGSEAPARKMDDLFVLHEAVNRDGPGAREAAEGLSRLALRPDADAQVLVVAVDALIGAEGQGRGAPGALLGWLMQVADANSVSRAVIAGRIASAGPELKARMVAPVVGRLRGAQSPGLQVEWIRILILLGEEGRAEALALAEAGQLSPKADEIARTLVDIG